MEITEDYVSFEVAKLLKEKGFDVPCMYFYKDGKFNTDTSGYENWNHEIFDVEASAPTLQMAMKWLREVHKIFIEIDYVILANSFFEYSYTISNMNTGRPVASNPFRDNFDSYEEACDAAIKYYLKNKLKI